MLLLLTAELLLHSERVSRHIAGVEQALTELREGLEVLSDNQNDRIDRLIDDAMRLDRLFTAATKTSRYRLIRCCRGISLV